MHRRIPLAATVALAAVLSTTACANTGAAKSGADEYPGSKPVTIVVGFDAGGGTDVGARLMAQALEEELKGTVEVVNKPGAVGQIGMTEVANSTPDGYTFGTLNLPTMALSELYENRGATYTRDDFTPLALQVEDPTMLVVLSSSPYKTLDDLLAGAKEKPNTLRVATSGVGSDEHFAMLELENVSGADFAPVHFADGAAAATTAFLGGNNVEVLMANVSEIASLVEDGSARPLGLMSEERSPLLPDVPTFKEEGHDIVMASSRGYVFPAGTPQDIVDKVSAAMGRILEKEDFLKKMKDLQLTPKYMDSRELGTYWDETKTTYEALIPQVEADK